MKGESAWCIEKRILFSVLIFIISMPLLWGALFPLSSYMEANWYGAFKYSLSTLTAILLMYLTWGKSTFSLKCPEYFRNLFTFGLLGVIGAAGAFIFSSDGIDLTPSITIIAGCIFCNLAIAICEEVIFRGIILNSMIAALKKRDDVVRLTVIGSSIIFGLRHLINLVSMPDTVFMTLAQVVFTFMAGTYLCAVYLRTKNIWVCITIHFLEDFATSVWAIFSSSAAASASVDGSLLAAAGMIALQIPYVVFAVLMLKDKKWNKAIITEKSSKGI